MIRCSFSTGKVIFSPIADIAQSTPYRKNTVAISKDRRDAIVKSVTPFVTQRDIFCQAFTAKRDMKYDE
jgi:hypothetical protein